MLREDKNAYVLLKNVIWLIELMQFNSRAHFWTKRPAAHKPENSYFITNSTHQLLVTKTNRDNGSYKITAELYSLNGKQLLGPHTKYEEDFNSKGKHLRTKFHADVPRVIFGVVQNSFQPITTAEDIKNHIKPFADVLIDALKTCKPDHAKHASELRDLYNLFEPHKRTYIDIGASGLKRQMKKP